MASLTILGLTIITIISTMGALEAERLSHSIIALAASASSIGTIFIIMGAPYAGVFQLVVYGGVLIILFMAVASFTEDTEPEKPATTEDH